MKSKYDRTYRTSSGWTTVFVSALFVGALITSILLERIPESGKKDEVDAEKVIYAKRAPEQVDPRFIPVMIYRTNSNDTNMAAQAGVGTLFNAKNSQLILTAEHLFLQKYGSRVFAYRKLHTEDTNDVYGISHMVHTGREIGMTNNPDVAMVASGEPARIECYADRPASTTFRHTIFSVLGTNWLRSLVSNERLRIVGLYKDPKDGVTYTLIENYSIEGESGTGLLDQDGNLFVLKGHMSWMSVEDEKRAQKLLGTKKPLSIAFGPLRVNF